VVRQDFSKHEACARKVAPNSALHRTADHKVHGRGRSMSAFNLLLRARVLKRRRAAAELGS
jgi:hypothetical protein